MSGVIQKYYYSPHSSKDRWDVDFSDGTTEKCAKEFLKKYLAGPWPIVPGKRKAAHSRRKRAGAPGQSTQSDDENEDECLSASDLEDDEKSDSAQSDQEGSIPDVTDGEDESSDEEESSLPLSERRRRLAELEGSRVTTTLASEDAAEDDPPADAAPVLEKCAGKYEVVWTNNITHIIADQRAQDGWLRESPPILDLSSLPQEVLETKFLKYLLIWYPLEFIEYQCRVIHETGSAKYGVQFISGGRALDTGLFVSFLGCWFYMCCNPGYTRDEYWAERASEVSRIAHNLGEKSKLQRHDFDHILEYFVLPEYVSGVPFTDPLSPSDCGLPEGIPPDDAFRQVRRFIDGLNKHWRTVFTPGTKLTIDESMIKWLSRYLCPGWVKVGRKPDSMGHELKTLVDSTSRILFQFELQEGKEYDNRKKFVAEYGATCAMVLRMLEPFKSTGRIVIGDSWFGSTKTALLLYEWGIYSVLNVKTAHKFFPKFALLAALKDKGLGEFVAYRTEVALTSGLTMRLNAVGHKGPGKMTAKRAKSVGWQQVKGVPLLLVSTCSTTLPAEARGFNSTSNSEIVPGMKDVTRKECPQVETSGMYRARYGDVDKHNRQRTGKVAIHDVWRTQAWEKRDFGELLGVMCVNGENAWTRFDIDGKATLAHQHAGRKVSAHSEFLHGLTGDCFNNPFLPKSVESCGVEGLLALNSAPAKSTRYRHRQSSVSSSVVSANTVCRQVPVSLEKTVYQRCTAPGCEAPDGRAYRTAMKCATCHMVDERPAWVCAAARSACWDLHVQYAFSHKMAHTPKRVCKHKKAEHNQEELLRIASSKRLKL
ncbi:hypothetical protein CYMTET_38242 [Cymbomonas tetramitiformis]|uniref:PiggyBac transposable element-derived protein domain-containing protein n=1 Tax=Cymbomonas tetramitiformis TaxID=36881 RepID=A0AAE0F5N9_9CHLO|nr:hypothetical protein CYMTET_38242 [Cymbomonas tetramitiformis]